MQTRDVAKTLNADHLSEQISVIRTNYERRRKSGRAMSHCVKMAFEAELQRCYDRLAEQRRELE